MKPSKSDWTRDKHEHSLKFYSIFFSDEIVMMLNSFFVQSFMFDPLQKIFQTKFFPFSYLKDFNWSHPLLIIVMFSSFNHYHNWIQREQSPDFSRHGSQNGKIRSVRTLSTSALRGIVLLINLLFGIFGAVVTILAIFILSDTKFQIIASQTKSMDGIIHLEMEALMILLLFGALLTIFMSIFEIWSKKS